jgi:predicted transcriptional regulator
MLPSFLIYSFCIYLSKVQHTDGSQNDHSLDTDSPKLRPKTVTKHRTGGYQQRLVHIGAVGLNTPKPTQDQTLSPKSENCYICGKEYLLSSLKIHEKQCAKKHEKTSKINNDKSSKLTTKTSSKISKKPQLEACYLCGKEFFVHSLGIHETQCIKIWKANKTPDAKDQTVSERTMTEKQCNNPGEDTKVDFCMQTGQKSTKKEQTKNQTASPKLLKYEMKSDLENNASNQKEQSNLKEATKNQNASPKHERKTDSPKQRSLKTTPCYLCGVAFLPHSLKIHEKKCKRQSENFSHKYVSGNMVEKDDKPGVENFTLQDTEESQNKTDPQSIKETNDSLDPGNNSSKTYISKKPKTIVCYICGQEFLKSSYAFHEKKCAGMNESTKVEEMPIGNSKVNTQNPAKPRTIICYTCGEEFLKSSYPFHEKKCSYIAEDLQKKETVPEPTKTNQNQVKHSLKPRTIICYICGQEFLKSSYAFHEKQCSKKTTFEDFEAQNEESRSKRNIKSKEKASSDSKLERPQTPRRGPKTKSCYICGKEILLSSLKVHEQQCQKKTDILKNINQQRSPAQNKKAGRHSET